MSLDNAAQHEFSTSEPVENTAVLETYEQIGITDQFTYMTDRMLLESIARDINAVKVAGIEAIDKLGPLANSPMFGMLSKFIK